MKKRNLYFNLILLIFFVSTIFVSAYLVSGEVTYGDTGSFDLNNRPEWLKSWETGGVSLNEIAIKYFFLVLIIMLIYSTLTFATFPENALARIGLSVVVSFLATMYITPSEFWAILNSYTALGITLALFLPILILIFFTIMVATKGAPIGMFFTRIIWAFYGIYIILKGALIIIIKRGIDPASLTALSGATAETIGSLSVQINWTKDLFGSIASYLVPMTSVTSQVQAAKSDGIVGFLLLVGGCIAVYVGVFSQDYITRLLRRIMREEEKEVLSDKMKKGAEFYRVGAETAEDIAKKTSKEGGK